MEKLKSIHKSTIFLFVLVFAANIANVLYAVNETKPSPAFTLIYSVAFFWGMGWWIREDSLKNDIKWVHDIGFLIYIAWIVVIPFYLFQTRGWKAFLTIFVFLGFYLLSYAVSLILFVTIKFFGA